MKIIKLHESSIIDKNVWFKILKTLPIPRGIDNSDDYLKVVKLYIKTAGNVFWLFSLSNNPIIENLIDVDSETYNAIIEFSKAYPDDDFLGINNRDSKVNQFVLGKTANDYVQ
jgi:hypothetical protein